MSALSQGRLKYQIAYLLVIPGATALLIALGYTIETGAPRYFSGVVLLRMYFGFVAAISVLYVGHKLTRPHGDKAAFATGLAWGLAVPLLFRLLPMERVLLGELALARTRFEPLIIFPFVLMYVVLPGLYLWILIGREGREEHE